MSSLIFLGNTYERLEAELTQRPRVVLSCEVGKLHDRYSLIVREGQATPKAVRVEVRERNNGLVLRLPSHLSIPDDIFIVGRRLEIIPMRGAQADLSLLARERDTLGEAFVRRLSRLRVGVVGLGKLGFHVFTGLMQRVSHIVGVDRDMHERENLAFVPGLGRQYLNKPKVDFYMNLANSCGQSATVINGDVLRPAISRELIHCHVVFDCTDSQLAKLHLLNMCLRYGQVLIQSGVALGDGTLRGFSNLIIPGINWCSYCTRTLNLDFASWEALDPEMRMLAEGLELPPAREPLGVGLLSKEVACQALKLLYRLLLDQPLVHRIVVDWNEPNTQVRAENLTPARGCPLCQSSLVGAGDSERVSTSRAL